MWAAESQGCCAKSRQFRLGATHIALAGCNQLVHSCDGLWRTRPWYDLTLIREARTAGTIALDNGVRIEAANIIDELNVTAHFSGARIRRESVQHFLGIESHASANFAKRNASDTGLSHPPGLGHARALFQAVGVDQSMLAFCSAILAAASNPRGSISVSPRDAELRHARASARAACAHRSHAHGP
jgi:hypothetical protein